MPNCNSYQLLTHKEKIEFTARLLHAMQTSEEVFYQCSILIEYAEQRGAFNDVKFFPETSLSLLQ